MKKEKKSTSKKIGYLILDDESWALVSESFGEYGLAYGKVEPLFNFLGLSLEESAKVAGVSSRTLSRWDNRTVIGIAASERAAKIDHLVKLGVEIFKSESAFKNWFEEKNFSMDGKSPKEILGQPFGIDLIRDTLLAAEFGNVM